MSVLFSGSNCLSSNIYLAKSNEFSTGLSTCGIEHTMQAPVKQIETIDPPAPRVQQGKMIARWLVIILGVGLGFAVGWLVSGGNWLYAVAVAVLIPFTAIIASRPFLGVIIWLLIMPFASVLPNSDKIYWAIHRLLIPGILVLIILLRALRVNQRQPIRLGPPELAMGILAVLGPSLILLFQKEDSVPLIRYADRMILPFCMYLIIRLTSPREGEIRLLQWTALFIVVSQSMIGILSWFAPGILPTAWLYLQGARTSGSLIDPAVYTSMLIFCITLLFQGAMNRQPDIIRTLFLMACGLGMICVFLSLERSAWLGGALVMIGLFILWPKPMLRVAVFGGILGIILGSGLLSTPFNKTGERITDPQPVYDRIVVFDAMSQMVQIKPILGWGYETLDQNIQFYYRRVGDAVIARNVITSHNTYLTILTELGIVGILLYLFPIFWWFVLSLRHWRKLPSEGLWSRSLLAATWLAGVHYLVVSSFMDMRWFPIGLTLWWMMLGFVANMVYPLTKPSEENAFGSSRQDGIVLRVRTYKLDSEKDAA
jgi:O-antigen ligase